MKRRFAVIMAALLIAAMAGCSQSGTSSTAEQSTTQSSADSSVAESAESEISEAESSVVSETASTESSEEKSDTSVAESSDKSSKTESSQPKTEESSKKETSKAESSKAETSKTESSKPESSKAEEPKVTGINLDMSSLSMTAGNSYELNAYVLWSNGTSSYQGITWTTSNNGVASVSSSGYVTAKSAGTATITASYGSYSKSCTVTVKAAQSSQPSGGNGGSTSKPSGGSQTKPPESSTPPEISYGNEPSSTPSTGFGYYGTYPQKVSGSWGWIRYRGDNLYWLIEDGKYKDEKGKTYSAKFNPSEHEAVKSRNGKYTFYLCPEAITVLNEMAAEEGKHFTWETEDNFWYCAGDRRGCADNLEYLRETDSAASPHETNYSDSSPALILGSMHDFDWYWFFDDMRNNAKSHWKLLMNGNRLKPQRTVMVYYVAESGGFEVAIK